MGTRESRFGDKTVVVTGASRGIGKEIAAQFAGEGARLVMTGSESGTINAARDDIRAQHGGRVRAEAFDVADETAVSRFCASVRNLEGRVDVLVNCAAISARGLVAETPLTTWERIMAVNLTGTFLMARGLIPLMGAGASILNMSSQAGKRGEALVAAYAASKAAQLGFTKSLARELAPNIRVNAICPGIVETTMMLEHYETLARLRGDTVDDVRTALLTDVPLGRPQDVKTIAALALFISSDDGIDLTGQALDASGGAVMN